MEDSEHYTSLQEFTEDLSPRGASRVKRGAECLRGQRALLVFTVLLASVCANIALGVLLFNRPRVSTPESLAPVKDPHDLSTELKLNSLQTRYNRLCKDFSALGASCSKTVRKCSPCPEGWLHLEDKCYHFSPDKLDWEKSRDSCASMGSHLAILYSHKQHDLLEVEAKKIGGFDYHFWIGLSDLETEGVWKWVDNRIVNDTYVQSSAGIGISGSLNQTTTTQGVSRVKTVQFWTPAPNPGLMCPVIIYTSASVKWTLLTLIETD